MALTKQAKTLTEKNLKQALQALQTTQRYIESNEKSKRDVINLL